MRQSEKELQKVEKIKEITSDIQDCEKDLWEVDLKILQLIKYVEGIETTDTGIVIRKGGTCIIEGDILPNRQLMGLFQGIQYMLMRKKYT